MKTHITHTVTFAESGPRRGGFCNITAAAIITCTVSDLERISRWQMLWVLAQIILLWLPMRIVVPVSRRKQAPTFVVHTYRVRCYCGEVWLTFCGTIINTHDAMQCVCDSRATRRTYITWSGSRSMLSYMAHVGVSRASAYQSMSALRHSWLDGRRLICIVVCVGLQSLRHQSCVMCRPIAAFATPASWHGRTA